MAKDLRYYLKFDSNGRKVMADLGVSSKQLDAALEGVGRSAAQTQKNMLGMASATVVLDGIASAVNALSACCKGLTDAYAAQVQVETQLEQVMRNRMDATDAQIASIKELCSAQQELGIIGDEVQLAGAQQLATFLENKDALAMLIPAMNDLVAQQAGYAATAQNATSAATLMGKAMSGNANALKRMGINLTEAQKKILEQGDEMQRAAILCDVLAKKYGGVNAALARTDSGKLKQLENTLGDVKEQLGGYASAIIPAITTTNQLFLAGTNLGKLKPVYTMLASTQAAVTAKVIAHGVAVEGATLANKAYTASTNVLSAGLQKLGLSASAASVALKALGAASVIGLGITALIGIIDKFTASTNKATQSAQGFKTAIAAISADMSAPSGFISSGDLDQDLKTIKEKRDQINNEIQELKAIGRNLEAQKSVIESRAVKGKDGKLVVKGEDAERYKEIRAQLKEAREKLSALQANDKDWAKLGKDTQQKPLDTSQFLNVDEIDAEIKRLTLSLKDLKDEGAKFDVRKQIKALEQRKRGLQKQAGAVRIPVSLDDARNKAEVEAKIADITKKLNEATTEEAYQNLSRELAQWEDLLRRWDFLMKHPGSGRPVRVVGIEGNGTPSIMGDKPAKDVDGRAKYTAAYYKSQSTGEDMPMIGNYVNESAGALFQTPKPVTLPVKVELSDSTQNWAEEYKKQFEEVKDSGVDAFGQISKAWGGVKGIASGIESITKVTDENASAWEKVCGVVDGALQLYQGIAAVMQVVQAVAQALNATEAAGIGIKTASASASQEKTNAQVTEAASGALAANSNIPVAGIAIGLGAVAALVAAMFALPKFAKGGIAYGPTLGLFGEYSGAANNPEVVAPLDRLRSMLQPQGGPINYTFKLRGRDLVATADAQTNFTKRT